MAPSMRLTSFADADADAQKAANTNAQSFMVETIVFQTLG
jgi:hypothetical protein